MSKNTLKLLKLTVFFDSFILCLRYKMEVTANAHTIIRSLGGLPSVCVSSCAPEKFDFQEDVAASANHILLQALNQEDLIPFNFISTDFVSDDIIDRIMALNTMQKTGAGPVTQSEVLQGSRDNLLTEVRVDRSFAIMDSSTLDRTGTFGRMGTLESRRGTGERTGTLERSSTLDRSMTTGDQARTEVWESVI